MSVAKDIHRTCEEIRRDVLRATYAGSFEEARALALRGVDLAGASGDKDLIDRASCNLAALEVELGKTQVAKKAMNQLLLRSSNPLIGYLAAYTLSRAHQVDQDHAKALRHVSTARRYAEMLCCPKRRANCLNQEGLLLLKGSDFEGASARFEEALGLIAPEPSLSRALVLDNRGYCQVVLGQVESGFKSLFAALRTVRSVGAEPWEACVRISLSFAYLEVRRTHRALQHSRAALALGERYGDRDDVKFALFLLGEAEKREGNLLVARRMFQQLQEEYYPGAPGVSDLLLVLDVRNVVNIKG